MSAVSNLTVSMPPGIEWMTIWPDIPLDPIEKRVYIYRANSSIETLNNPREISGEPLLKGFTLKLEGILD